MRRLLVKPLNIGEKFREFCGNESHVDNKSDSFLSLSPCRKYVPEVKDLPLEYLFEPWTAPAAVQEAAGCVLGRNYPLPLADHKEQQKVCMQRLKELAQNLGTDMRGKLSALKCLTLSISVSSLFRSAEI